MIGNSKVFTKANFGYACVAWPLFSQWFSQRPEVLIKLSSYHVLETTAMQLVHAVCANKAIICIGEHEIFSPREVKNDKFKF